MICFWRGAWELDRDEVLIPSLQPMNDVILFPDMMLS